MFITIGTYIGIFFLCLWIADFLTGLAHWAEDTYCRSGYPIIGALICEPNLMHHKDPNLLVRTSSFVGRNYVQWLVCGVIYVILWALGFGFFPIFLTLFLASFGNEVHYWNHTTKLGWFPTFIKMTGLVQSQKQHSLHHKPPHTSYYCALTSFVNPVLELVKFWRCLEWLLEKGLGIAPVREGSEALPVKPKRRPVPARSRKTVRMKRSIVVESR